MANKTKNILKKIGIGLLVAAFWIGLWTIGSLWVGKELFLPTPWAVLKALGRQLLSEGFWITVGLSLLRVLQGTLPGILLGAVGGVVTANVKVLDLLFSPLLTVVRATPVSSFIMLALFLLGKDSTPPLIVFLMVLPIVWANVAEGIKAVDPSLKEVCALYKLPLSRRFKILYVPQVLPYFTAGTLTALGLAWKAGIAAEVLCTPANSIGKMVYDAKTYMETADLFAWTAVVILLSLLLETTLKKLLKGRAKG